MIRKRSGHEVLYKRRRHRLKIFLEKGCLWRLQARTPDDVGGSVGADAGK